jgi:hypothetical protein
LTARAEETLARIASGEWTRALLPMIPLMQGGKEARIIEQWKTVAAAEPDERRRGDYGSLARVFADLAKRGRVWRQALEGWNMKRSESVMEWQAETMTEAVIEVLQLRFGTELPEDLVTRIRGTTDLALLKRWHAAAVTARTLNKFRQAMDA